MEKIAVAMLRSKIMKLKRVVMGKILLFYSLFYCAFFGSDCRMPLHKVDDWCGLKLPVIFGHYLKVIGSRNGGG